MSEGVRRDPVRSSEAPKAFASLTGKKQNIRPKTKTTRCFFLRHHCLGSGALARNQGEKKYVDVCLQGYMCGLVLEDVLPQILRP